MKPIFTVIASHNFANKKLRQQIGGVLILHELKDSDSNKRTLLNFTLFTYGAVRSGYHPREL